MVATHLGQVTVRLPRFRCPGCDAIEAGVGWPSHCRSTPEFDQLQAHFSALMPYRVAADLLKQVFPIDAGKDPETVRRHTLKISATLRIDAETRPEMAAAAVAVTLDSTFIRSCEDGERHLEVRVGNAETETGGRQAFGAVAKTDADVKVLICQSLDAVGRTKDTVLTAFTDGCAGLRRILADAGITELPILDWFHDICRQSGLPASAERQTCRGYRACGRARPGIGTAGSLCQSLGTAAFRGPATAHRDCRALIAQPSVLLMDEPMAALDKSLREDLQIELKSLQRRLGVTILYITHDQREAMALADHMAVLNAGRIEQTDAPQKLFSTPQTSFVALFVGDATIFRGAPVADHAGQ